jgi:tetratricopeptide (TPR) repeat protein
MRHSIRRTSRGLRMAGLLAVLLSTALPAGLPRAAQAGEGKAGGKKGQAKDPKMEEAVSRFETAVSFFDQKNYGAALAEFLESYALVPNDALLYNIGVCYYETGKYTAALEAFDKFLAWSGDGIEAKVKAKVETFKAKIDGKIGFLVVKCGQEGAVLEVDGGSGRLLPLDDPVPLDPGIHAIAVYKAGFETHREEFTVASKKTVVLDVTLEAVEKKEKAGKAAAPPPAEEKKEKAKGKKPLRWLALALGGGGALGAAGVVMGGLTYKTKKDFDKAGRACTSTMTRADCPKVYDLSDKGKAYQISADVLLGAAAAVAITGMILFILDKPRGAEKKPGSVASSFRLFPVVEAPGSTSQGPAMGIGAGFDF